MAAASAGCFQAALSAWAARGRRTAASDFPPRTLVRKEYGLMSEMSEKAEGQGDASPEDGARTVPTDGARSGGTAAGSGVSDARPLVVHFSNPEEFLAELRSRGPNLEPVVQITFRWTRDESGAPLV